MMASDPTYDDDDVHEAEYSGRPYRARAGPGDRSVIGTGVARSVEGGQGPARRYSQTLPLMVAILALGTFFGIVWYAYTWGGDASEEEIPVIKAEKGPTKVRPEDPGGLSVPH